jgi:hypothetical protein
MSEVTRESSPPATTATADAESAGHVAAGGGERRRVAVFADRRLGLLVASVPVITTAALLAFGFFPGDPMLASGLGSVVVGFVVFLLFASRIPDTFALVRLRGLVPRRCAPAYQQFELEVGRQLNSRWSIVLAAFGALIGFARYPVAAGGIEPLIGQGPAALIVRGPIALADMLGETLIGAAAGLAIWRMIVIGFKVGDLGRFPLRVQLGHPDRCGGFEPLGNLCLWNALILSVPGVFLGWWIIVGPSSQYGLRYVALHSALASIVVVLATIAFVVPLWRVHLVMARSAEKLRAGIERNGQRIDQLARELVAARDDLGPDEWESKAKELERLQALYRANEKVPTWPIDVHLATKFGTSQLVPLLGITGLSKPIVDVIKAFTSLLDPGGL